MNNRNKKKFNISARKSLPLLIAAVAVVIFTAVTVAIYTNQSYQKGVAITADSDAMFSSNVLRQVANSVKSYTNRDAVVTIDGDNDETSFSFEVYNYAPNMTTRVNPNDINYDLKIKSVAPNENAETLSFSVEKSGETSHQSTGGECKIENNYLKGGSIQIHSYTVKIPTSAVSKGYYFEIVAEPQNDSASAVNNKKLAANIYTVLASAGTSESNSWSGRLTEASVNGLTASQCSAFNYEISGTGKGKVTLKWLSTVKIDTFFLSEMEIKETNIETTRSIEFDVDSDVQSIYNIRFYLTGDKLNEFPAITFSYQGKNTDPGAE